MRHSEMWLLVAFSSDSALPLGLKEMLARPKDLPGSHCPFFSVPNTFFIPKL